MRFSTFTVQARLASLGFHPGPIDGVYGRRTQSARNDALDHFGGTRDSDLFGPAGLSRVHWHWTAGADGIIKVEEDSYNALIDRQGIEHPGKYPDEAQATYAPGRAASHTLNCNGHAVGLSMDCMAGAIERPFKAGSAPMTWECVHGLVRSTAQRCARYWIPVSRFSTLSHSEIQPTFGITQRWKWDINWLPDMDRPGDPIEVGDRLRDMVRAELANAV